MNLEMVIDGQRLVKVEINLPLLKRVIREAIREQEAGFKSTPATDVQLRELLSRVDPKSAKFLNSIAMSDNGSITWAKMREIFGIKDDDWTAYSSSFGKGITRAYRKILENNSARLIWWDDDTWDVDNGDSPANLVYIDGPALTALRVAVL